MSNPRRSALAAAAILAHNHSAMYYADMGLCRPFSVQRFLGNGYDYAPGLNGFLSMSLSLSRLSDEYETSSRCYRSMGLTENRCIHLSRSVRSDGLSWTNSIACRDSGMD